MPKHELLEVTELRQAEVSCQACLLSFFADYAQTNVSLLDHCDVVASISNARYLFLGVGLDCLGDHGFLSRAASADAH